MKTFLRLLTAVIITAALHALADWPIYSHPPAPMFGSGPGQDEVALQQARKKMQENANRHPLRSVDGSTESIKGPGWKWFAGKVAQVHKDGVRVRGQFVDATSPTNSGYEGEFFVANYPLEVADGDEITSGQAMTAKESGTYKYSTVGGTTRTLRKLDYGKPVTALAPAPLTAGQIEARKKAAEEKQQALSERTLKYHQELAEKGDAYGQLRMGERYLTGDGVEKNLTKAREFLSKSAAQGNTTANAVLQKLSLESAAAHP